MKVLLSVSLLILLLGAACNHPVTPRNPKLGHYVLAGYDSSDQLIFTGEISFLSLSQNQLKGRCAVSRKKEYPIGVFNPRGRCEGSLDGEKVTIDLTPVSDDGGLVLKGEFDGGLISGFWMFDTSADSKPQGKFEAIKTFAQPIL